RLGVSVSSRWGWGPSASAKKMGCAGDCSPDLFAQAVHIAQSQPDRAVGFDGALPAGNLDVDGMEPHATALGVFDERRGMIEPHRLIVEKRGIERRRIVHLQIGARIG